MILFIFLAIGLVAWSLHLMQEAFNYKEFSLMLAGTLVASSAAALMVVYFLINGYFNYVSDASRLARSPEFEAWLATFESSEGFYGPETGFPVSDFESAPSLREDFLPLKPEPEIDRRLAIAGQPASR